MFVSGFCYWAKYTLWPILRASPLWIAVAGMVAGALYVGLGKFILGWLCSVVVLAALGFMWFQMRRRWEWPNSAWVGHAWRIGVFSTALWCGVSLINHGARHGPGWVTRVDREAEYEHFVDEAQYNRHQYVSGGPVLVIACFLGWAVIAELRSKHST
jgi:hypothetical protein